MMDLIEISVIRSAERCGIRINDSSKIEVPVDCPFCNDSKQHMSLNTIKNVFRCNRCGESGNSITLYSRLTGCTTKEAYRELVGEGVNNQEFTTKREREPNSIMDRHEVYTALLDMLTLSEYHRGNLMNRGLDMATIDKNMYRTAPIKSEADKIVETLSSKYNLLGIPGFYTNHDKWNMVLQTGLFIPVRDKGGYIQGLQIRLDDERDRKYRWFSSRFKDNGTRAYSWIHVTNASTGRDVFITEGALKADVATYLSGDRDCFVGLSGVSGTYGLTSLLVSINVNRVYEAFDMDKRTNRHVAMAAERLRYELAGAGIACTTYEWDEGRKGVDDHLLFCRWLDTCQLAV